MAIQLVIIILRGLCDKYAKTKEQEKRIYKARHFLDIAFSNYKNKQELKGIVNGLDRDFFNQTAIKDEIRNIKAFIYTICIKADII